MENQVPQTVEESKEQVTKLHELSMRKVAKEMVEQSVVLEFTHLLAQEMLDSRDGLTPEKAINEAEGVWGIMKKISNHPVTWDYRAANLLNIEAAKLHIRERYLGYLDFDGFTFLTTEKGEKLMKDFYSRLNQLQSKEVIDKLVEMRRAALNGVVEGE